LRSHRPVFALHFTLFAFLAWGACGYTPPPLIRDDVNLQPASSCRSCHLDITQQWSRSAHTRADRTKNELFGRMYFYSLKQTRGGTMLACGPCHETASFVNQDFEFVREVSQDGVTCVYCHYVGGPADRGIPPYTLDLSAYHGTIRNPIPTNTHSSAYSAYLKGSDFCGGCHAYSNQHGVKIADTYGEWRRSRYAKQGMTCQSCHMPGKAGRNSNQGPVRPRVADHSFDIEDLVAARPHAATLSLTGARRPGSDTLRVFATATNAGWGHSLPTGNDQNLALIRIRVLGADGTIVWENDPFSEWNVSVFGLILADELGNWPADTWNAVKTLSDRRIRAGATARVRYDVPLSGKKGALRVEARLLYRRSKPGTITAYGLNEDTYGAERTLAEAELRVP
jgi:nitrate/TMAO reductase-like tetraheme cytochrome c subunit